MSKGGGSQTTNTVAQPWSVAQPFLRDLLGDAASTYQGGGFDPQPWTGPRVAPQSGMTQQALQGFYDIGTQGNPITPQAQAAFGDMVGGDNIYSGLSEVKQNVLADVIPAASSRFANSGMLDSSMAADTISRAASSAIAPIEYGAYDNAQNRRLSALGLAPALASNSYLDSQMMSMAGGQLDQYNQALLDSARGSYSDQINRPYDELQRAASLALGFGGLGGSQSSRSGGGGGGTMGTIGDVMQVVGPILGMAAMAFSDRRLKRDIRRVGRTAEGYAKYRYRYLWDKPGTVRVGVMADEMPSHLVRETGGFKMVDYTGVTL